MPGQGKNSQKFNIIYFLDGRKTHHLRLSITQGRIIFVVSLLLLVWSVVSIFSIAWLNTQRQALQTNLQQALQVVFDFESRYEGLFEKAYPTGSTESLIAQKDQHESVESNPAPKPAPKMEMQARTAATQTVAATGAEPAPVDENTNSELGVKEVSILSPETSVAGGKLAINFTIKNAGAPEKADGFLWSMAKVTNKNGIVSTIYLPDHVKIDNKGEVIIRSAHRYSIRRFTDKKFAATLPRGLAGGKAQVTIFASDLKGAAVEETKLPEVSIPDEEEKSAKPPAP